MKNKNANKIESSKLKIGIVGLGMVGTPIMKWLIDSQGYKRGKDLYCFDADPKKKFQDDINMADMIFIAVPTPIGKGGACDISIIERVVKTIDDGKVIIIKSTIAPQTSEILQAKYPNKRFVFNPEFLTESQAWEDFLKPQRQLMGHTVKSYGDVANILAILPSAYYTRPWYSDYTKKDITATEAELVKYASNVFGYIKVIFSNILADISFAIKKDYESREIEASVNYENIREALGADSRIGPAWTNVEHGSYAGAGGYCFPKDMKALIAFVDSLASRIENVKSKDAQNLAQSLRMGNLVLKSVQAYNVNLLEWQNLTLEEVSVHNKDLITKKRKKIRE